MLFNLNNVIMMILFSKYDCIAAHSLSGMLLDALSMTNVECRRISPVPLDSRLTLDSIGSGKGWPRRGLRALLVAVALGLLDVELLVVLGALLDAVALQVGRDHNKIVILLPTPGKITFAKNPPFSN